MRGITIMITGTFLIAVVGLVAGILAEPIANVALASEAVRELGWQDKVTNIRDTILQWTILLGILYNVVWAGMWAIRRERSTEVRRR